MSLFSPIHHTFAPHVDTLYVLKSHTIACAPWKWRRGESLKKLKVALSKQYNAEVFLFASGREAFFSLLKALNLNNGEEVIVQGYTCVAVPNAVHAAGKITVVIEFPPASNADCNIIQYDYLRGHRMLTHLSSAPSGQPQSSSTMFSDRGTSCGS